MTAESSVEAGHRIRLGMVGGGQGAFIGAVHRFAARLDGEFELVAGALSSDPDRALASGRALGIPVDRTYGSFVEMAGREAKRPDGIEAVAIVTPNHMHFAPAKLFLEAGVHVICDKPLTATLDEAEELARIARRSGKLFVLTHNYTGYPMVRQARAMIASGEVGEVRVVQAEYAQDWLTERAEDGGSKQAEWRTDPRRSGAGGCIGDIGTHAYNLVSFVTGLELESLCADLSALVPARALDDNAHVLLRFGGGARGMLWASQVAVGNENRLVLRVYGTKGGLEWSQEQPDQLWYTPYGRPRQMITRNGSGADDASRRVSRIPAGHPEGYLEAFANIYAEAARAVRAARNGTARDPDVVFPTVEDGVKGVAFVDACVRSSAGGASWISV
ncbi:MAG TPA: Gfo/Idh/MocA family oxidoreductase [Nannocystis sp.]